MAAAAAGGKKPPNREEQVSEELRAAKERFLVMSREGYASNVGGGQEGGRNLHWTTDVSTELPIHLEAGDGLASLEPVTIPQLFR